MTLLIRLNITFNDFNQKTQNQIVIYQKYIFQCICVSYGIKSPDDSRKLNKIDNNYRENKKYISTSNGMFENQWHFVYCLVLL